MKRQGLEALEARQMLSAAAAAAAVTPYVPNGPWGLIGSATSPTSVDVVFRDNADNEGGFVLQRADEWGTTPGEFTTLAVLGPHAGTGLVSYTDNAVVPGAQYVYRVKSTGPFGDSAYCPAFSVNTPLVDSGKPVGNGTVPNAPFGVTAAPAAVGPGITVKFYDASEDETGLVLRRWWDMAGHGIMSIDLPAHPGTGWVTYTDTTAAAGVQYYYQVESAMGPYASDPAPYGSYVTATGPGTPSAPNAPFGVTVTATAPHTANITFYDNSDDESEFAVFAQPSFGFPVVRDLAHAGRGWVTVVDHNWLGPSANEQYWVQAIKGQYASARVGPVGVSSDLPSHPTLPTDDAGQSTPIAPSALVISQQPNGDALVRFNDNSNIETGFVIQRSVNGGAFTDWVKLPAHAATGMVVYADAALASGTSFAYRVAAERYGSRSAYTGAVTFGSPTMPNGPFALSATAASATSVTLKFYDNSDNEQSFVVERATSVNGPFKQVGTTGPFAWYGFQTYTDTTAQSGTTYYYRVYAVNGPYASSVAGPVGVTTPTEGKALHLDGTFGVNGIVKDGSLGWGLAVAATRDDKFIVLAGRPYDPAVLERLNADGSIDTSFGVNGRAALPVQTITLSYGGGLAVQADGKVVVAGTLARSNASDPDKSDVFVERFTAAGKPDATFGSSGTGILNFNWGTTEIVSDVAIRPSDGDIYVAGEMEIPGDGRMIFSIRLRPGGTLDSYYGVNGLSTAGTPYGGATGIALDPQSSNLIQLGLQGSGNSGLRSGGFVTSWSGNLLGQFDFDFPNSGIMLRYANDVIVQPDGNFVVAGVVGNGAMVARYHSDWSRDTTFDQLGHLVPWPGIPPYGTQVVPVAGFRAVAQLPDGSLVAGGTYGQRVGSDYQNGDALFVHVNPDGSADTTTGPNGMIRLDLGTGDDRVWGLATLTDGSVIAVGGGIGLAVMKLKEG